MCNVQDGDVNNSNFAFHKTNDIPLRSIEILSSVSLKDGERLDDTELTLVYICKANLPDLSVFNIERIQNFRMKNLCERSLYRPGSDSFLSAERFRIDPACS